MGSALLWLPLIYLTLCAFWSRCPGTAGIRDVVINGSMKEPPYFPLMALLLHVPLSLCLCRFTYFRHLMVHTVSSSPAVHSFLIPASSFTPSLSLVQFVWALIFDRSPILFFFSTPPVHCYLTIQLTSSPNQSESPVCVLETVLHFIPPFMGARGIQNCFLLSFTCCG